MKQKKEEKENKKISRKELDERLEELSKLSRERELNKQKIKFGTVNNQKKEGGNIIKETSRNNQQKEKIKNRLEELKKSFLKTPQAKKPIIKQQTPSKETTEEEKPIKPTTKEDYTKGENLENYDLEIDKSKVHVNIKKTEKGIIYILKIPKVNPATRVLLDEIRSELVTETTVGMAEIADPNAFVKIKQRFMDAASKLLKEKIPTIQSEMQQFLVSKLMQEMMGLGRIEFLINDPRLEEVVIPTSKEPIRVYYKKYGWIKTNLRVATEEAISNYSNIIARRVGRQINVLVPLLDAHLLSGDRVNAIQFPIATKGNTITIRKFARDPYTIVDLINNKTIDIDTAVLLWLAIEYEMNVIISGGTASGKTVILNACMPFIPPNHRIISVEDTRELMLPEFLYWTPLVTRTANPEGKGKVTMLDLLVNSLRMRPDRIVLGEMRRQEEAMVLFEAMHTGHSVYATLHADSAAETVSRLINPPLNVPPNLLKAVNLNVVMFRDRRKGIRRVLQVAEFNADQDSASANILYRWVAETDKVAKHAESSRFFEDVSRNTGMSQVEIDKNLEQKKEILNAMIKEKIRELQSFGKIMNFYYTNKEELMKQVQQANLKKLLGK